MLHCCVFIKACFIPYQLLRLETVWFWLCLAYVNPNNAKELAFFALGKSEEKSLGDQFLSWSDVPLLPSLLPFDKIFCTASAVQAKAAFATQFPCSWLVHTDLSWLSLYVRIKNYTSLCKKFGGNMNNLLCLLLSGQSVSQLTKFQIWNGSDEIEYGWHQLNRC